ncbi:MAG: hypothetical protein AAFP18_05695 [Bacteroidota bacterium]
MLRVPVLSLTLSSLVAASGLLAVQAQPVALPNVSQAAAHAAPASHTSAALFRTGLDVPSVDPGATARVVASAYRDELGASPMLVLLELTMPAVLETIESELEGIGFARRDYGVAIAYAFVYLWEAARGETMPEEPSAAAARSLAEAIAAQQGEAYASLTDSEQERRYETVMTATTVLAALNEQNDPGRAVREQAALAFTALFGVDPGAVSVDAAGVISGFELAGPTTSAPSEATKPNAPPVHGADASTPTPRMARGGEALPPTDTHGVEVYIKYTWGYGGSGFTTDQIPLLLYPDGTAFLETPQAPVANFAPATLRAAFAQERRGERHVGTWRRDATTLTLTFDGETRTLPRTSRGWWDRDSPPDESNGHHTFFPVVLATPEHMVGPWVSSSLIVAGTPGGAAPQVAAGSTTNRVFYGDGTYAEDSESFVSATDANVGSGYGGGSTFGLFSENEGQAAGRWRLDGPLMTIETGGQRQVLLAFIMPEWSKDNPNSDTWVGDDFWERPDED